MPRTNKKTKRKDSGEAATPAAAVGTVTVVEPPVKTTSTPASDSSKSQATQQNTTDSTTRKRKRGKRGKGQQQEEEEEAQPASIPAETTTQSISAPKKPKTAATPAPTASEKTTAGGGPKRKRSRKRNRRTTAAEDAESSSGSDSDTEDDESTPVIPARAKPTSASSSDSSDDSSSDEETKVPSAAKKAIVIPPPKSQMKTPSGAELGPDPASASPALSEQTQRALAYAQRFARDRASWKFEKQRQNWLLRHVLDVYLSSPGIDSTDEAAVEEKGANGAGNGKEEEDEDGDVRVPGAYVHVLAYYYAHMVGGAKARIIETLREAANKVIPDEDQDAAIEAIPSTSETAAPTFSIGDLALQKEAQEEKEKGADVENAAKLKAARDELRRRKEVGRRLLELMGEL
ncbi:hypothetical protein CF327_g7262 [Tilletia walkeri]|nr:hypothetical protein CF327_g7262 [Tilletia walkeri]